MSRASDKPVLNIDEATLVESAHGEHFAAAMATLAPRIGASQLGCRLTIVPAGKRAWPFHCHHANEELFFIIEGSGSYRFGDQHYPLRAGDVVAAPAGGAEQAHQIINDSAAPLKYLAISTMRAPDIMEYPDSGKFSVFAGAAPGADKKNRSFSATVPVAAAVDYWQGEN